MSRTIDEPVQPETRSHKNQAFQSGGAAAPQTVFIPAFGLIALEIAKYGEIALNRGKSRLEKEKSNGLPDRVVGNSGPRISAFRPASANLKVSWPTLTISCYSLNNALHFPFGKPKTIP
jgi:hypothetical protein